MGNELKERLDGGDYCLNGWLAIPSGFSAEVMAQCGWQSVTVDLQHGVQDYHSLVSCFQSMGAHPVTPLVRVPWNEPGIIGKVLDAGAWGVICPMINTPEDAAAFASACLYPPHGKRSNGPIRAAAYGEASAYQTIANAEILVLPMIETRQAVENIDAILDTPGISGIYVGPGDLAFSLGKLPALDREEDEFLAIYESLIQKTRKRGKVAGIHTGTAAYSARMIKMGFNFISIANDSGLMARAARDVIRETHEVVKSLSSSNKE
ncbi:HpcH/HpaI aldolase family protein [Paraburkholderia fynbosensis]|uniref:4-hydroxy-2-oxo-heptane-1,7-dioate aldolase n=1 Tax=Paraburkholderia fynbosensis TaxID=1200993 RepID=A0A6J5GVI7_9BURK|nr:aldolase/citrate lyase family protein [Paraburkholderia fynbosensis]CAB3806986.1 4-hydroxy-2-oxo-heptane-1,7-dioate aldolase [Paraburkholderia fynbosensis]